MRHRNLDIGLAASLSNRAFELEHEGEDRGDRDEQFFGDRPPGAHGEIDGTGELRIVQDRDVGAAGKLADRQRDVAARRFFRSAVERINAACRGGDGGPLHRLLERQPYRLAYWRVASDEINYRRFFDINELACVRMEKPEVFEATHRLVRQLVASGAVDGLRIDHVDGLSDPRGYFARLQQALGQEVAGPADAGGAGFYLLAEKILAGHEQMPGDWRIAGTTGYEVGQLLNDLFVDTRNERRLNREYRRFTGRAESFDEIVYDAKKLVIFHALSSELTVLANLLNGIAQSDPHTRDFTFHGLREALAELVARFPVYRTYVTDRAASEQDRRYIQWALGQAKKHSRAADTQVFDFIAGLLISGGAEDGTGDGRASGDDGRDDNGRAAAGEGKDADDVGDDHVTRTGRFIRRFQQYTAPVTAKAVEDTACYVYNRLVALNEVGASPARFGTSPHAFHSAVRQRRETWPDAMVSTSTHDTKRSEDVRARIDVLSEIPDEWHRHLVRWSRLNRGRKRLAGGQPAPSRNDEYFLYQTLVGVWPSRDDADDALRDRLQVYLLKAVKEAKVHTSWLNPDAEYEAAVAHFVDALLRNPSRNAFLSDFVPFQRRVAHYGMLNGLSQTLLKLGLPGVPDIYQGNEVWNFALVDPDNRRPVDYAARRAKLDALQAACRDREDHAPLLADLLGDPADGRAKLYLTWRALELRRRMPDVFRYADYVGLPAEGDLADHVVAFARHHGEHRILFAVARWYRGLVDDPEQRPCGDVWRDTVLPLPVAHERRVFRDQLSGAAIATDVADGRARLACRNLFAHWPVALLVEEAV